MKVKSVIKTHDVDGYYSANIFHISSTDEQISNYIDPDMTMDEFDDRYEVSEETVYKFKWYKGWQSYNTMR